MRVLWFSHFVPFPPRGGNLQRSFNLIRQASLCHEIHLLALNLLGEPKQQLRTYEAELKHYCESVTVCELPFPWRGGRWWAEAMCSPLFRAPFSCQALFSTSILAHWNQLLKTHIEALLHFDSIDLALYSDAAKDFRKVLNHHNCESAVVYRQAQKERNPVQKKYFELQAAKLSNVERTLCEKFNVNLVVSEQDRQLLRAIQPNGHYYIVENGVDTRHFTPIEKERDPHSLIFTGQLQWSPNISGIRFLVEQIWPDVKKRFADTRLYLAGRNPPERVIRWSKEDPNITIVANPEDMRPWLARAAVSVCPILEGGGTRLKILDAMAMGKPVVSTTIGCEGLRVVPGENILVADTPRNFADNLIRLLESEDLRRQIGGAGRALVEREYSWERIGQQLAQAYEHARRTESGEISVRDAEQMIRR